MDVLVQHGKHGDHLWAAGTKEELRNSALAIVKINYNSNWYYAPDEAEPTWDGLPLEEIKKLKDIDEDAYQAVVKKWNNYRRRLEGWKQEKEQWNLVGKAVNENDGQAAWELMLEREDHEYEGFTIESIAVADSEGNVTY